MAQAGKSESGTRQQANSDELGQLFRSCFTAPPERSAGPEGPDNHRELLQQRGVGNVGRITAACSRRRSDVSEHSSSTSFPKPRGFGHHRDKCDPLRSAEGCSVQVAFLVTSIGVGRCAGLIACKSKGLWPLVCRDGKVKCSWRPASAGK